MVSCRPCKTSKEINKNKKTFLLELRNKSSFQSYAKEEYLLVTKAGFCFLLMRE